ncbi:MAG: hypothetical protein HY870_13240 [Chloroflexi bacterium]|nr:hypothetical protein [Chloroflexota bacterium]
MPTHHPSDPETLTWHYDIPLITNRYILWDMFRVFALSLFAIVALTGCIGVLLGDPVLLPIELLLLIGGILAALWVFVTLGLFRNRYRARFVLDSRQAVFHSLGWGDSGWDRTMKRLLKVLAFFAASSDPTTRSATNIRWRAVRKVNVNRSARVIALCDSWHVVMRLYCPPDMFEQALAHVQYHTGDAQA